MLSYDSWTVLRPRVDAMAADRRAAFALACAEGAVGSDQGLRAALASGWSALVDQTDGAEILSDLEHSRELDEDTVATTFYALSSVHGDADAAWWAASRALYQAFDSVLTLSSSRAITRSARPSRPTIALMASLWTGAALTGTKLGRTVCPGGDNQACVISSKRR